MKHTWIADSQSISTSCKINLNRPIQHVQRTQGMKTTPAILYGNAKTVQRNQGVVYLANPSFTDCRVIDIKGVSGHYEWAVKAESWPSFNDFVVNATIRRPDMQRFYALQWKLGVKEARSCWSQYIYAHHWFEIPAAWKSAQSFARDELEVY